MPDQPPIGTNELGKHLDRLSELELRRFIITYLPRLRRNVAEGMSPAKMVVEILYHVADNDCVNECIGWALEFLRELEDDPYSLSEVSFDLDDLIRCMLPHADDGNRRLLGLIIPCLHDELPGIYCKRIEQLLPGHKEDPCNDLLVCQGKTSPDVTLAPVAPARWNKLRWDPECEVLIPIHIPDPEDLPPLWAELRKRYEEQKLVGRLTVVMVTWPQPVVCPPGARILPPPRFTKDMLDPYFERVVRALGWKNTGVGYRISDWVGERARKRTALDNGNELDVVATYNHLKDVFKQINENRVLAKFERAMGFAN